MFPFLCIPLNLKYSWYNLLYAATFHICTPLYVLPRDVRYTGRYALRHTILKLMCLPEPVAAPYHSWPARVSYYSRKHITCLNGLFILEFLHFHVFLRFTSYRSEGDSGSVCQMVEENVNQLLKILHDSYEMFPPLSRMLLRTYILINLIVFLSAVKTLLLDR